LSDLCPFDLTAADLLLLPNDGRKEWFVDALLLATVDDKPSPSSKEAASTFR